VQGWNPWLGAKPPDPHLQPSFFKLVSQECEILDLGWKGVKQKASRLKAKGSVLLLRLFLHLSFLIFHPHALILNLILNLVVPG
jgi:hypothetical protein